MKGFIFKWIAVSSLLLVCLTNQAFTREIVEKDSGIKANPPSNRFKADSHVNETDELYRLTSLTVRLTKVAEDQGSGNGLIDELPNGIESLDGIKGVDTIAFLLSPKLGGTGIRENLFAQNRQINQGLWRSFDDKIGKLIDETGSALLIYFLEYEAKSTSSRPTRLAISVLRDNKNDETFKADNPSTLPK